MEIYSLPPIRCQNCNRPIGHLINLFDPLFTILDHFEIYNLNLCCRSALQFTEKIVLNKPDHFKMNGNKKENTLTPLTSSTNEVTTNSEKVGIPISYQLDCKITKLSDDLYLNYVTTATYMAR